LNLMMLWKKLAYKHSMRFVLLMLCGLVVLNCARKPNKFSDPVLIEIANLQDRRSTDSLLQFLHSENLTYRKEATLAFASVQDSAAVSSLGKLLLEDKDAEIRKNAAFALGQTKSRASANALIPAINDKDADVLREVLEALGKTVAKNDASVLLDYSPKDSLTTEGLAWGFYRLAVRGLADSIVLEKMADYLQSEYSYQTRLAAAHFFLRGKIEMKKFEELILLSAREDKSAEVRMALSNALRKVTEQKALPVLESILKNETDYRVRVSAVRAFAGFPLNELVFNALKDKSLSVQIAASEIILNGIGEVHFKRLEEDISNVENIRVKANLYGALLRSVPYDSVVSEIIKLYSTGDNYTRAHLINSLSYAKEQNVTEVISFLTEELADSQEFVIKSSAAQALVSINKTIGLEKESQFIEIYKAAILDGDPAVIGIIANALSDDKLGYKELIKDFGFLKVARGKLSLPGDYESLQPLEEAIAYFEGKEKPAPPKNAFNHPINWKLGKSIKKDQQVHIKTNKGDIILKLFVEETPGSVVNFIDLIHKKYFDSRFVHRVVPNFVIQTGCNRGDGFGSENYSIRSEFSTRRYKTGSVGMASAGKDTEGTQWFITHSPTPHLDGSYTLFAETVSGMSVVDSIEVGDQIISVTLVENK
jgi:cyclophilin family peptidyl-prolyl cis-trans isomerase/HEAT repeat protein